MELEGHVAIVTGAGSGIGRATALRLAEEGADIVVADMRSDGGAEESAHLVERRGREALVARVDVTDRKAFLGVVETALSRFRRIDCLINNAGVFMPMPFLEMTEEIWDRTLSVNTKAVLFCTQSVARHWVAEGKRGKVVSIGSVHATRSWATLTAYASSRSALRGLTRVMALELAPYGINVNMVSPGLIASPPVLELAKDPQFRDKVRSEIALKRMGRPEEVAELIAFLASNRADYITGEEFIIDGGLLLHPFSI